MSHTDEINLFSVSSILRVVRKVMRGSDVSVDIAKGSKNLSDEQRGWLTLKAGSKRLHVVSNPQQASRILGFIEHGQLQKPEQLGQSLSLFGQVGITASNGELWKRQRASINQTLLVVSPQTMAVFGRESQTLIQSWQANNGSQDLVEDVRGYCFKTFGKAVLGMELDIDTCKKIGNSVEALNKHGIFLAVLGEFGINTHKLLDYIPQARRAKQFLSAFVKNIYAKAHREGATESPIGKILLANDVFASPTHTNIMQAHEDIAHLIAATGTPVAALSNTLSSLLSKPDVYAALHGELMEAQNAPTPSARHAPKALLNFVMQSFMEKPPIPLSVPRRAETDLTIDDHTIRKGDLVIVNLQGVSLNSDHDMKPSISPFFKGQHMCPGRNFALMQAVTLISGFIKQSPGCAHHVQPVRYQQGLSRIPLGGSFKLAS